MKFLYDAGISLYGFAARIASMRGGKARMFVDGRKNAIDELERMTAERAPEGYDYWFHAASLGEFEQARPLIEAIKKDTPNAKILLSFFSPSGYNVRCNYDLATTVVYLPADTKKNASRFLEIARPRQAVFVKYEFWLNFLDALKQRNIPTYLISAIFRPGQIFFRPWGGTFRKRLEVYKCIYVQNEESARLLGKAGIQNVRITCDTRFYRVHDIMKDGTTFGAIDAWRRDAFTLVIGSSWPQDEDRYIDWINNHPEVRVILAPHEFDDRRIERLHECLKSPSQRWTDADMDVEGAIREDVQTLIVNTFGKLSSLYRYADVAIVGGGFGTGIHNINEAAVYGLPVLFGPNNHKFKEAGDLKNVGGGFEFKNGKELSELLDRFVKDKEYLSAASEAAGSYIKNNLGATAVIYSDLRKDNMTD